jgi:hypothetical protein
LAQARIEAGLRAATALFEARFGRPGFGGRLLGQHLVQALQIMEMAGPVAANGAARIALVQAIGEATTASA